MSLNELKSSKATVVMFICNHCPYVKHVSHALVRLANDYMPKGVSFIAISSNDPVQYPEDAPDKMREEALRVGYPFPYLFDETQDVARAYGAACTPTPLSSTATCAWFTVVNWMTPARTVAWKQPQPMCVQRLMPFWQVSR